MFTCNFFNEVWRHKTSPAIKEFPIKETILYEMIAETDENTHIIHIEHI